MRLNLFSNFKLLRFYIFAGAVLFTCLFFLSSGLHAQESGDLEDELAAFATIVQGYFTDDYVYALPVGSDVYISPQQFAQAAGFTMQDDLSGYWAVPSRKFTIDVQNAVARFNGSKPITIESRFIREFDGQYFFSSEFYRELFPKVRAEFDQRRMIMTIESDEQLPYTELRELRKTAGNVRLPRQRESFKEYTFDKRLFSWPVLDVTLGYGLNAANGNASARDSYALNLGMLFLNMDGRAFIFGSSERDPGVNVLLSRVFLDDNPKFLQPARLQIGDISGIGGGFFTGSASGRGIAISSYKDIITSADRTITITGDLAEGWEAELYLNNQLISFRQPSVGGRYEFPDIPVTYGLSNFRVVLYGPAGEIAFEERRYYSGRSPVGPGEAGYSMSAYQSGRHVVERSGDGASDSNEVTFDSMFYYGLSQAITLMAGFTRTADDAGYSDSMGQYGTFGAMYVAQAITMQYNAQYGFKNEALGHSVSAQGNIYVADMFVRYQYYDDLLSPVSYRSGSRIKDLFETRFTGRLMITKRSVLPWAASFVETNSNDGSNNKTINARLSPTYGGVFLNLENAYDIYSYAGGGISERNLITFNMSRALGLISLGAGALVETIPDTDWREVNARLSLRAGRRTSASFGASNYNMPDKNVQTYTAYLGTLLPFGTVAMSASYNSKDVLSAFFSYGISFGKNPHRAAVFVSPETRLAGRAVVGVKAIDEFGEPISDIDIRGGGGALATTDDYGTAIVLALPSYAKASVASVRTEDLSLTPVKDAHKHVFRPGTVYPLEMTFIHKGEVEGQIKFKSPGARPRRGALMGYTVQLIDSEGKVVSQTYTDNEGYFVLEAATYGHYKVVVLRFDGTVAVTHKINLDDIIFTIQKPLEI